MQLYLKFLKESGEKFIIYKSIAWIYYHGFLQPRSFPHIKVSLSQNEAKELLASSKASFLRWTSKFDCGYQTQWWHVIKDDKSDLSLLSSNTRNQIRRGQKIAQFVK